MRPVLDFPSRKGSRFELPGLALLLVLGGCAGDADARADASGAPPDRAVPAAEPRQPPVAAMAEEAARDTVAVDIPVLIARADSAIRIEVDRARRTLNTVGHLTARERRALRTYLNEDHVAMGRRLGVGPVRDRAMLAALVERGDLVVLDSATPFWVVREMDHSTPHVTPATRALLQEIGHRFQERLAERGLPAFRMEIASGLRTSAEQAALRRRNPNASRSVSSHQFGTTVDIAYNRFSPPPDFAPVLQLLDEPDVPGWARPLLEARAAAAVDTLSMQRGRELKGVLGEVLHAVQREGKAIVIHERGQPVFHVTTARAAAAPPPGTRAAGRPTQH